MNKKHTVDKLKKDNSEPETGDKLNEIVTTNEKDKDELAQANNEITTSKQQDPDDAVHEVRKEPPLPENETDVDDLMHR